MGYLLLTLVVITIIIVHRRFIDEIPNWIVITLQAFCVVYLAAAQFLTGTEGDDYGKFIKFHMNLLYEKKTALTLAAASLLFITSLPNRRRGQQHRQYLMEAMLFELFENDKRHFRITIFRDVWWIKEKWLNLYRFCLYYSPIGISQGKDFRRSHYIIIEERLGKEHSKSKRSFPWSDQQIAHCQGVAARVRNQEVPECVDDAPNINGFNIAELAALIRDSDKKKQAKQQQRLLLYMEKTYISDIYLIAKLNWRATQIFAQAILNKDGDIIGVLVIDSDRPDTTKIPFDNPDLQLKIDRYVNLIGKTY